MLGREIGDDAWGCVQTRDIIIIGVNGVKIGLKIEFEKFI